MRNIILTLLILFGSIPIANAFVFTEPMNLNAMGNYVSYSVGHPTLRGQDVYWASNENYDYSWHDPDNGSSFLGYDEMYFKFDGTNKSPISFEDYQAAKLMPKDPTEYAAWAVNSQVGDPFDYYYTLFIAHGNDIQTHNAAFYITSVDVNDHGVAWTEANEYVKYSYLIDDFDPATTTAPEPATLCLFGAGLLGMIRRRNAKRD